MCGHPVKRITWNVSVEASILERPEGAVLHSLQSGRWQSDILRNGGICLRGRSGPVDCDAEACSNGEQNILAKCMSAQVQVSCIRSKILVHFVTLIEHVSQLLSVLPSLHLCFSGLFSIQLLERRL